MTAPTQVLHTPTIGQSPRRMVLFKHRVIAHNELSTVIPGTFDELYGRIGSSGVTPAGPPFVIYHEGSEPGVRWEIDICAPVSAPISAAPEFEFMDMPEGKVVTLLHVGPYDSIGQAYEAIERFVAEQGLKMAGPPREMYLSEPDVPPAEIQTLVEWPIG